MLEQRVEFHILLFEYDSALRMPNCWDPVVSRDSQMKEQSRVQDWSMIEIQGSNAPNQASRSQIVILFLRTKCSLSKYEWGL